MTGEQVTGGKRMNRREVIRLASVAGAVGAASAAGLGVQAAAASPAAQGRRRVSTFVFVAGSNGGAGSVAELGLLGHRSVGVALPGHGVTDAQFDVSYQAPQDLEAFAARPSPMAGFTLGGIGEELAGGSDWRLGCRFCPLLSRFHLGLGGIGLRNSVIMGIFVG